MPIDHPTGGSNTALVEPHDDIFAVLAPLVRHWRLSLGIPTALVVLVAGLTFLLPRKYTASTTFTPSSAGGEGFSGSLANIAGQFGISLEGSGGASPDFFAQLLGSREILTEALTARYGATATDSGKPLLDILEIDEETQPERVAEGIKTLSKRVLTTVDKRTGVVTLTVQLGEPKLAADVANQMVAAMNRFNLERMQTQSRERRRFIGERLRESEGTLRAAENAQLEFLRTNRSYSAAALLVVEANRLQRQVDLQQELVSTLRREYEQSRIAEVRDTPVITVIDPAVPPTRKSAPSLLLNGMIAGVLGLALGIAAAYVTHLRQTARRTGSVAYADLVGAVHTFRSDLRRAMPRQRRPREAVGDR